MVKLFLLSILVSFSAFGEYSPYLDTFSDPINFDSLKKDFELKLGRTLEYAFYDNSTPDQIKNLTFTEHHCFSPDTQQYVEDCMMRVFRDPITRRFIFVKLDLPAVAGLNPPTYFKSNKSIHQISLELASKFPDESFHFEQEVYYNSHLVYRFSSFSKLGQTEIFVSRLGKIIGKRFTPEIHFLKAEVYPLWEETVSQNFKHPYKLIPGKKIKTQLKNLESQGVQSDKPLYTAFKGPHLEVSGEQIDQIIQAALAPHANLRKTPYNQVMLDGKFVTVLEHPNSEKHIQFDKIYKNDPHYKWEEIEKQWFLTISESIFAYPLSENESYINPIRLPDHDLEQYINSPTDGIHVYRAVDTFYSHLTDLGFNDFDSERIKIKAYLHDPDPFWKNNAFFRSGTINFGYYTPEATNFARDTTVIWHELGHAVFNHLVALNGGYKKGGGINEGFSDFISHYMYRYLGNENSEPGYSDQRHFSQQKFNFANQNHDDGEAFGGTLKDILENQLKLNLTSRRIAFEKNLDLVLNTLRFMRYTKNLQEHEFFQTMMWVDENFETSVRKKNEFKKLITDALSKRNFALKSSEQSSISMSINGKVSEIQGYGTMYDKISLPEDENDSLYEVQVKFNDGLFKPIFPLTVKLYPSNPKFQSIIMEVVGTKEAIINEINETATFRFKVKHKCSEYNLDKNHCLANAKILFWEAGSEWHFAKKRVNFLIKKQN